MMSGKGIMMPSLMILAVLFPVFIAGLSQTPPPTPTPPPPPTSPRPPTTRPPPTTTLGFPPKPTLIPPARNFHRSYFLVAPGSIRPGMRYRISVDILKSYSWTALTALIKLNGKVISSRVGKFRKGISGRISFKIPENLNEGRYTLTVLSRGALRFTASRTLKLVRTRMSMYIQTDKGIYKPGDKVNLRTFALYPNLQSYKQSFDIFIHDPNNNMIQRWLNQSSEHGVIVKEFELSSRPVLGAWTISFKTSSKKESIKKTFKVEEYVLPKFEANVLMPSYVLLNYENIIFTVAGKYTFGKPVNGTVDVYLKLLHSHQTYELSTKKPFMHITLPIIGNTPFKIPMQKVTENEKYSIAGRKLGVLATVTENLTGNVMKAFGEVIIYKEMAKLEFPKINPKFFKPGLVYNAYLKVSQPDGQPIALSDKVVVVSVSQKIQGEAVYTWNREWRKWEVSPPHTRTQNQKPMNLNVPENGLVVIPIQTSRNATSVTVNARYEKVSRYLQLSQTHSRSNHFIQLSLLSKMAIKAGDDVEFELKSTEKIGTLRYQILSKGEVVYSGRLQGNNELIYRFTLRAISHYAPSAKIIINHLRDNNEVIVDSISFDVSGAFRNKMSMELSDNTVEPGNDVRVRVTADPGSQAFLMAVDQSVLLLASGNDITPDEVYGNLESFDTSIVHPGPIIPFNEGFRMRRPFIGLPYPTYLGGTDCYSLYQNADVIVIADVEIYRYVRPHYNHYIAATMMARPAEKGSASDGQPTQAPSLQQVDKVRSNFPETWLWTDVKLCANGEASVVAAVPDTITSWIASGFAVNAFSGFGMPDAPSALKVFKRFFISLNLPYSVIMGEEVAIEVIIFNYMSTDQNIRVTLEASATFKSLYVDCNGVEYKMQTDQVVNIRVEAGRTAAVFFPIIPVMLGLAEIQVRAQSLIAADAVRRQLIVQAPGIAMDYNIPVLVDLTSSSHFSKTVSLSLPDNTVEGSELIRISAIGDLMGPSINGLDKLLRMPTGCGEQTMISLAPDVYITEYLTITNQLNGRIKEKALRFMEKGYQNELNYKHRDGSYSAFRRDKSGSMWLTAFVARVFKQASRHIYVDPDVIKAAIKWIVSKQNKDGSFPEPGRVIHKEMQGRSASSVSLSAFVYISLLENRDLFPKDHLFYKKVQEAQARCLTYLEHQVAKSEDLYLLTLSLYAFQLGDSNHTDTLLDRVNAKANTTDGLIHWSLKESKKAKIGRWHRPNPVNAVNVEMTSYVLLALGLRKDIASGRKILQWVTQQRNANGGFASTQDTVVGLYALSVYAEMIYSKHFNVKVSCTMDHGETYNFKINEHNALMTQRRDSKRIPSEIEVEGHGHGMALVEVSVFFNVEEEIEDTTFDLNVTVQNENGKNLFVESCTSWLGDGKASGMAVQEVGIPSGFSADTEGLSKYESVRRFETEDKKLILYFDEITTEPLCIKLLFERVGLVARAKPSFIKIYDYYEPSNQKTVFYSSNMLSHLKICAICPDCFGCHNDTEGPPKELKGVTPLDEDKQIQAELNRKSSSQ